MSLETQVREVVDNLISSLDGRVNSTGAEELRVAFYGLALYQVENMFAIINNGLGPSLDEYFALPYRVSLQHFRRDLLITQYIRAGYSGKDAGAVMSLGSKPETNKVSFSQTSHRYGISPTAFRKNPTMALLGPDVEISSVKMHETRQKAKAQFIKLGNTVLAPAFRPFIHQFAYELVPSMLDLAIKFLPERNFAQRQDGCEIEQRTIL